MTTDIFTTAISAFKSATDVTPATVTLRQFLFSKKYQDKIIALRQVDDKKERDAIKKTLPAATISGTFTKRAAANIVQYNGLVCLDFDGADNPGKSPAEMKSDLAEYDEVAYAAVSVGGKGVFAIIPTTNTDPERHAAIVDMLGATFAREDGLHYDRACKDVSRLRFVSWDAECVHNPDATPFDASRIFADIEAREAARPPRPLILRQPAASSNNPSGRPDRTRERVESLIGAVETSRADLTSNYDDWLKLGFSIASHFGSDGEDYYHRLSQFHTDYDHAATAKKYENLLRHGRRIKIGTFFKILEHNGFSL